MNLSLLLFIVGLPIGIFVVSNFLKYPFELSGEDKKRALDDFKSDIGLDFYFIGLSIIIATSIALFGVTIPQDVWICMIIYSIVSAVIARLYVLPWFDRRINLCCLLGLVSGAMPILYAFYVCLLLL